MPKPASTFVIRQLARLIVVAGCLWLGYLLAANAWLWTGGLQRLLERSTPSARATCELAWSVVPLHVKARGVSFELHAPLVFIELDRVEAELEPAALASGQLSIRALRGDAQRLRVAPSLRPRALAPFAPRPALTISHFDVTVRELVIDEVTVRGRMSLIGSWTRNQRGVHGELNAKLREGVLIHEQSRLSATLVGTVRGSLLLPHHRTDSTNLFRHLDADAALTMLVNDLDWRPPRSGLALIASGPGIVGIHGSVREGRLAPGSQVTALLGPAEAVTPQGRLVAAPLLARLEHHAPASRLTVLARAFFGAAGRPAKKDDGGPRLASGQGELMARVDLGGSGSIAAEAHFAGRELRASWGGFEAAAIAQGHAQALGDLERGVTSADGHISFDARAGRRGKPGAAISGRVRIQQARGDATAGSLRASLELSPLHRLKLVPPLPLNRHEVSLPLATSNVRAALAFRWQEEEATLTLIHARSGQASGCGRWTFAGERVQGGALIQLGSTSLGIASDGPQSIWTRSPSRQWQRDHLEPHQQGSLVALGASVPPMRSWARTTPQPGERP